MTVGHLDLPPREDEALSDYSEAPDSDSSLEIEQKARQLQRRERSDNRPGPGHTLDKVYQWIGDRVGNYAVDAKKALHLGVTGVSHDIKQLRRHDTLTIIDLYNSDGHSHADPELRKVEERCEQLVRHAQSILLVRKLHAYRKITYFATFDPLLRNIFSNIADREKTGFLFDIDQKVRAEQWPHPSTCLSDDGGDPEIATAWKALVAVRRVELHELWKKFYILICTTGSTPDSEQTWYTDEFLPAVTKHVVDPRTSSLFIQHWYYALKAVHAFQKASRGKAIDSAPSMYNISLPAQASDPGTDNAISSPRDSVNGMDADSLLPQSVPNVDYAKLSLIDDVKNHLQKAYETAKLKVDARLVKRSMKKHRRLTQDMQASP